MIGAGGGIVVFELIIDCRDLIRYMMHNRIDPDTLDRSVGEYLTKCHGVPTYFRPSLPAPGHAYLTYADLDQFFAHIELTDIGQRIAAHPAILAVEISVRRGFLTIRG